MNLTVLDKNFNAVLIIDSYQSLIWTDRYWACGDFELYTSVDTTLLESVKCDYYITSPESDRIMCIDTIRISTDTESESNMTFQGYSLEKILSRRIIWGYMKFEDQNPQDVIESLLNDCIIDPTSNNRPERASRKIENFRFKKSTDSAITELKGITVEYSGDNLYDVVADICKTNKIGFKITLDYENGSPVFIFELYAGKDRSYNQETNSYVIFSPDFDNLITSNYMETNASLRNVAIVGSKGSLDTRTYTEVDLVNATGIDRRELFVDARDMVSTDDTTMEQRGKERLAEYEDVSSFEGQAETRHMFKYEQDFFVGDIVQFADGYGHEASARIVEMITADGNDGLSVYPTFETIQKEESKAE